jgi:hypothetical protein
MHVSGAKRSSFCECRVIFTFTFSQVTRKYFLCIFLVHENISKTIQGVHEKFTWNYYHGFHYKYYMHHAFNFGGHWFKTQVKQNFLLIQPHGPLIGRGRGWGKPPPHPPLSTGLSSGEIFPLAEIGNEQLPPIHRKGHSKKMSMSVVLNSTSWME